MRNLSIPPQPYHELIETLWNVNQQRLLPFTGQNTELIETLWNVNLFHQLLELRLTQN